MTTLDPRIGCLSNGDHYAFCDGYERPMTRGTLPQVQAALRRADTAQARGQDRGQARPKPMTMRRAMAIATRRDATSEGEALMAAKVLRRSREREMFRVVYERWASAIEADPVHYCN